MEYSLIEKLDKLFQIHKVRIVFFDVDIWGWKVGGEKNDTILPNAEITFHLLHSSNKRTRKTRALSTSNSCLFSPSNLETNHQ